MNRAERAQLAAEVRRQVIADLRHDLWRPATVTDPPTPSDAQCGVLVDTETVTVGEADTGGAPDGTVEYGQIVGDPPALDERVMVRYRPGGGMEIAATAGGAWRLLGADYVAGGTANDTTKSASSTEGEILALEVEVDIPRPNRSILIFVNVMVGATVGGTVGNGRVYREDLDSSGAAVATEIGRWCRQDLRSTASDGSLCSAVCADFAPDNGAVRYYLTMQVTNGFTVIYDFTTDPSVAALLAVYDAGPLPEGIAPLT